MAADYTVVVTEANYQAIFPNVSTVQEFGVSVNSVNMPSLLQFVSRLDNSNRLHVETEPTDQFFDRVELLMHMDGESGSTTFVDNSKNVIPITAIGGTQIDTSIYKYGTGSAFFDGTSGYMDLPPSSAFNYGTGDFTVEFWFRSPETRVGGFGRVLGHPVSHNTTGVFQIWHAYTTSLGATLDGVGLALPNGTGVIVQTTVPVTPLGWCHIAFTRHAGIARCFLNGELQGTAASSENFNLGSVEGIRIGNRGDLAATTYLKGNLDDLRITKGYARYVESFTAPTAPFPNAGEPTVTITTMAPDWRRPRRAI